MLVLNVLESNEDTEARRRLIYGISRPHFLHGVPRFLLTAGAHHRL